MREDQIDQAERRLVQRNDQRVREQAQQGTTFKAFADADTEIPAGRFQSIAAARVVGGSPDIAGQYPACSPALAVQLPDEPPLGFDNPAIDDPAGVYPVSAPAEPGSAADPAPFDHAEEQRPAAGPSSQKDQDNG